VQPSVFRLVLLLLGRHGRDVQRSGWMGRDDPAARGLDRTVPGCHIKAINEGVRVR
jgi:hypothetical protein